MANQAASIRKFRIDDDLWSAAQTKAAAEGTDVSSVLRAAVVDYLNPPAGPEVKTLVIEPRTISIEDAAKLLGIGRAAGYAASKNGEWPIITFGGQVRVITERLLEQYGLAPESPGIPQRRPAGVGRWGSTYRLLDGRWEASYPDAKGRRQTSPKTFATHPAAAAWLRSMRKKMEA